MDFVTYKNTYNPHVTIHRSTCPQIRKHGGEHKHDQGRYEDHDTYEAALSHARASGLQVIDCHYCTPHG